MEKQKFGAQVAKIMRTYKSSPIGIQKGYKWVSNVVQGLLTLICSEVVIIVSVNILLVFYKFQK